jgi:hypothetical protein
MKIYVFAFVIFVLIYLYAIATDKCVEGLDQTYGTLCESCDNRSYGQCLRCYNCGFCESSDSIDSTGAYKGKCMKGDFSGPSDKTQKCNKWYSNDPFWSNAATEDQCIFPAFAK